MEEQIKKIIATQLGIDADKIKLESTFIEDLGADSLDIAELIMALETECGIDIPDEQAENLKTVQDTLNFIKSKKGNL